MAEEGSPERKFVVDTNILAYYALQTAPFHVEVAGLFSQPCKLIAPDSWRVEFLNVLWQAIRGKIISVDHGLMLLEEVERLLNWTVSVPSLWREALVLSCEYNCSTYDSLLVILAEREQSHLLTYDQALLTLFSSTAKRPGQVHIR
jgi:predicted nucleic acid-binding protein